jgi:hypothetical protein
MLNVKKAAKARRKLFEARAFRDEAVERLFPKGALVTNAIAALLEAGSIPCARSDNAEALGLDGANLLIAIGSQVPPYAIARETKRFAAMTLQIDAEKPKGAAGVGNPPREPVTFEADLTGMFQNSWQASRSASPSAINAFGVSLFWLDPQGSVLFGTIDRWERGEPSRHQKIYASEPLLPPLPPGGGEWDFEQVLACFQLPTVGGTCFSPLTLLGFCELLAEGVEDTAADLL